MEQMIDSSSEATQAYRWPLITRIGFRLVFCYFILYVFCDGTTSIILPIDRIPALDGAIGHSLWFPLSKLAVTVGTKFFHLQGIAATWHGGGSGDTALNWTLAFVFLMAASVATLVWSFLDYKRPAYPVLYAWLRFIVRLMLGVTMISYGCIKLFPLQMKPPHLGVLNEPLGQLAPFSLLWSVLGLFPAYERICGLTEVIAGALLLFRRTALGGALLTIFVMTNVLLYNLFFDVPVKLFAAHLVMFGLFLVLPDMAQLAGFLLLGRPAKPKGIWLPPIKRAGLLRAMKIAEVCYLVITLITLINLNNTRWHVFQSSYKPSPLVGSWAVRNISSSPIATAEGRPWTNIYFDNTFLAMVRDTSGQLWRYQLKYDPQKKTLSMRGIVDDTMFNWNVDDPNHITLVSVRKSQVSDMGRVVKRIPAAQVTLQLERQPIAKSYFLYDRGFHLVNEWGYEH